MTFENTKDLRDMFDVVKYWATAAGFGLAIPMVSFGVAVYIHMSDHASSRGCSAFWRRRCQHLPAADEERQSETQFRDLRVNWEWLTTRD
jgi:hypothetical protein